MYYCMLYLRRVAEKDRVAEVETAAGYHPHTVVAAPHDRVALQLKPVDGRVLLEERPNSQADVVRHDDVAQPRPAATDKVDGRAPR